MERQFIQDYIQQKLSNSEAQEFSTLRESNAGFKLLIDLVDACRKVVRPERVRPSSIAISNDQAETLIIRLLSYNIKKRDARTFFANLSDPVFYSKIHSCLITATTPESDILDEMFDVRIQTDEEIFNALMQNLKKKSLRKHNLKSALSFIRLENRALRWETLRKPALVAFVGILCLATITLLQFNQPENALYVKYFKTQQKPVRLESRVASTFENTLRSSRDALAENVEEMTTSYKLATASYINGDYKEALPEFHKIENIIETLDLSEKNAYFKIEYYFYYGMTHLNLAGSKGQHKHHLYEAIRCFSRCDETSVRFNLERFDDVAFFMALACHMVGDKVMLETTIKNLAQESNYYEDSQQLRDSN